MQLSYKDFSINSSRCSEEESKQRLQQKVQEMNIWIGENSIDVINIETHIDELIPVRFRLWYWVKKEN